MRKKTLFGIIGFVLLAAVIIFFGVGSNWLYNVKDFKSWFNGWTFKAAEKPAEKPAENGGENGGNEGDTTLDENNPVVTTAFDYSSALAAYPAQDRISENYTVANYTVFVGSYFGTDKNGDFINTQGKDLIIKVSGTTNSISFGIRSGSVDQTFYIDTVSTSADGETFSEEFISNDITKEMYIYGAGADEILMSLSAGTYRIHSVSALKIYNLTVTEDLSFQNDIVLGASV